MGADELAGCSGAEVNGDDADAEDAVGASVVKSEGCVGFAKSKIFVVVVDVCVEAGAGEGADCCCWEGTFWPKLKGEGASVAFGAGALGAALWEAATAKGFFTGCCAEPKLNKPVAGVDELKLKLGTPVPLLASVLVMPVPAVSGFASPALCDPNPPNPPLLPKPPKDLFALRLPTGIAPFVGGNDCVAGLPKEKGFPNGAPVG
jgi:hypothetical protein